MTLNRFLILCAAGLASTLGSAAGDDEVWTRFPNMNVVTSLAESESEIFIGTTGGIRRYDRFFERWRQPITTTEGLPSNRVRSMAYDEASGELWIDTPEGSGAWHTRLESFSFGSNAPDINPSPPIQIPPVVPPFGYFVEGRRIVGPRANYAITSALVDSWNTLWLGTTGLGVGRARLADELLEFLRYGPIESNVTAIARDGNSLWIGGGDFYRVRSQGITRFNTEEDQWEYLQPERRSREFDDLRITDILPQPEYVWFSTRNGLIRLSRSQERWKFYRLPREHPGGIRAMVRDGNRIWMGTDAGLAIYDIRADTIRLVAGSERFSIRSMSRDSTSIWAGTDLGLYRCPAGEVVWKPVGQTNAITRRSILAVTAGPGGVWAAVESPPRVIRVVGDGSDAEEAPMARVWGSRRVQIQADSSRVWLGTEQGVYRLDRRRMEWKQFTDYDGLLGTEVQTVLLDGEMVWFGTEEGLTRYHWADDFFERTD